jgi:hypothetical protein
MSSEEYHTTISAPHSTERVADSDGNDVGWVDDDGDIHRTGDTGTFNTEPETIGHVDSDGKVHMK